MQHNFTLHYLLKEIHVKDIASIAQFLATAQIQFKVFPPAPAHTNHTWDQYYWVILNDAETYKDIGAGRGTTLDGAFQEAYTCALQHLVRSRTSQGQLPDEVRQALYQRVTLEKATQEVMDEVANNVTDASLDSIVCAVALRHSSIVDMAELRAAYTRKVREEDQYHQLLQAVVAEATNIITDIPESPAQLTQLMKLASLRGVSAFDLVEAVSYIHKETPLSDYNVPF